MLSNTGGGETTTTTTTTSNTNTNGVVVSGGGGADIYAALSGLMANGIEVDKNLRQPTFYSWITFDELRIESFWIITDLLGNQKIPYWLSQRIAWYYSNKFFNEIVQDLSLSSEKCENEAKTFNREKLVIYLRKGISKVIKEWLNEKSRLINQNIKSLVFSFSRTSCDFIKPMIYYEYGLKNKRRIMEDKTACYENIDILSSHRLFDLKRTSDSENESDDDVENDHDVELRQPRRRPNSLFAVFDGHCGADCAQYVSTHLPMAIADSLTADAELPVEDMFKSTFQRVNDKFTEKAKEESLRSGTTACVCLLSTSSSHQNYVHVAWCGDTQCMIVKENGHISFMSAAHKPSSEAEKRRIESCGGTVTYQSSAWRVNGALAVARAFGDLDYQASGVTCLPECASIALDGTEQFLIIGCDGLWEGLLGTDSSNDSSDNPDEVINRDDWLAGLYDELRQRSNSNPAEFLVRRAKDNGSSDNITAVLVCLKENGLMHSASCSKPTESNILHL